MSALKIGFILLHSLLVENVYSFAYAPNFITKIIQEQTGIVPQGLSLEDVSSASSSDVAIKAPIEVRTRFPPEPNGYLHLGHAKAVSFNFAVARMFGGVCHMRMDDTNPSKEDKEYVDAILEDVKWIQSGLYTDDHPWSGSVRKTSDYFDQIYDCAVALIQSGDAYVDSLSADEMREYRGTLTEPGKDSPYRCRSIDENLEMFMKMKDGHFPEGSHVLRAKIDMSSPNINMRDPTLYRIKHESHQETGDKWCIYPMYDFSHPISDAVEGITHSLCSLEFEDHRPFYDWTIEKLLEAGLIHAKPQQIEFSRLNIQSTVLSKRKLIQLVQEKHVNGWDDPRMPTLSGIRRRGVPPEALRLFCERVGISKADSNIDYTNLEDCVREIMDDSCPRAFGILKPLKVTITNWVGGLEDFEVERHPKLQMGNRKIPFGSEIFIERSDFFDAEGPEGKTTNGKPPKGYKRLLPGGRVRLRYAYVIECKEIVRDDQTGEVIELKCEYFPDTRAGVTPENMARVQGIIHWVESSTSVKCKINQYDRLFQVDEPGKESGNFLRDINANSLETFAGSVVEPSVASDVMEKIVELRNSHGLYASSLAYQFERTGYFALDKEATEHDIIFNRVVTLRDTWGSEKKQGQRNRGSTASHPVEEKGAGPVEDIRRVAFTAATVASAKLHPEADGLLVCEIDCGETNENGDKTLRTVVAGLAGKIPLNELIGRKVVAVTNLKPAKLVGIESAAMLLAATGGNGENETVELLTVPDSVANGELLHFENKEASEPDAMMKSKGAVKAWERVKSGLRSNSDGEATFIEDGTAFRMLSSGGPIRTSSLKNAVIQ